MWEGPVADFNGNHPDQRKDLERISASVRVLGSRADPKTPADDL